MSWREKITGVWIVGGLAICKRAHFHSALEEISVKTGLASIPILITIFILKFSTKPNWDFIPALAKNFENGELYLFCSSMLASIFYISWKDRKGKPPFPNYRSHLLIVFGMMFLSGLIFAFKRAGLSLAQDLLTEFSYWFFLFALAMVVIATTMNNALNGSPDSLLRAGETDFVKDYSSHREEKS